MLVGVSSVLVMVMDNVKVFRFVCCLSLRS